MKTAIYLDNGATTKPLKSAIDDSLVFLNELFYNPSALYHEGIFVANEIKKAKQNILDTISSGFDLIFTSCGSESDNTAIFSYSKRGNVVSSLGEHSAVYETLNELKKSGHDVRFAKINSDGSVNVEDLLSLIDKNTSLVSVVHVNNETGAINDINEISKKVKEINPNTVFHSDGVQAFMKIPFRLSSSIDLYSVSAHKINALKGVGALFKNKKLNTLKPFVYGGGQEYGLRSGTENVFGIKVFESAVLYHNKILNKSYNNVKDLKEYLVKNLNTDIFEIISTENCSPYIVSLSAKNLKGEVLMHKLEEKGVIIGTGSACSSKNKHSRILTEAGYLNNVLDGVIRISFSSFNTINEITYVVDALNECAENLKRTITISK